MIREPLSTFWCPTNLSKKFLKSQLKVMHFPCEFYCIITCLFNNGRLVFENDCEAVAHFSWVTKQWNPVVIQIIKPGCRYSLPHMDSNGFLSFIIDPYDEDSRNKYHLETIRICMKYVANDNITQSIYILDVPRVCSTWHYLQSIIFPKFAILIWPAMSQRV
jgi:hypothetical protein